MSVELVRPPNETKGLMMLPTICELSDRPENTPSWPVVDDVFVNPRVQGHQLEGYSINPVRDGTVRGLGSVALIGVRHTGGENPDSPIRTHRNYKVELNGFGHDMEVTSPIDGTAAYTRFSYPGFTESGKGRVRQAMHARLAKGDPNAEIISIGTNGIGSGDNIKWSERSLHSIDAMGSQRLSLAKALAGDRPVFTMGTSMGCVIAQHMAHENFYGNPVDGSIDLAGMVWLSPALVDPKNIKDVATRFFPELGMDLATNILLKSNPFELARFIRMVSAHGLRGKDIIPLTSQLKDLYDGTVEQRISEVIDMVPVVVVAGENDSLAQWPMLHRLQEQHGSNMLNLTKVPGYGHSLSINTERACSIIGPLRREQIERALAERALEGSGVIVMPNSPPNKHLVLCKPLMPELELGVAPRRSLHYDPRNISELNLKPLLDPSFYLEKGIHHGLVALDKLTHLTHLSDIGHNLGLSVGEGQLHWKYPSAFDGLLTQIFKHDHSRTPVIKP